MAALALVMICLGGCKSKQDAAIDQARKQAATTGQAQQVVSTDKNGNTVTTVVQPPATGQTAQVETTTVTPNATAGTTTPNADSQTPGATPVVAPVPPPEVHIAAGTSLTIRIDQRISAKGSRAGEHFTGEILEPVNDDSGKTIVPKGSPVGGRVDFAHGRGNFKGAANIELRLTSLTLNGKEYPLETRDLLRHQKGKGKRSTGFIAGGTGLGALIGGIAGGGKGAVIGGLAGAGAGTAGAGMTGNRDLVIPAESIVHFKLRDELVIEP